MILNPKFDSGNWKNNNGIENKKFIIDRKVWLLLKIVDWIKKTKYCIDESWWII